MKVLNLFGTNTNLSALARRYFWTAIVVALLATAIGVLEGSGVGLLIPLLSTYGSNTALDNAGVLGTIERLADGYSRNERLFIVTSGIFGCLLLKSMLQVLLNAFEGWVDGCVGHDIRSKLARRLLNVGYSFFLVQEPTRLLNILSSESWKASEGVRVVLTRVAAASAIGVFSVMLLFVNIKLSLVVLVGGLVPRLIQKGIEAKLRELSIRTVSANQELADRMLFTVFGARVIRLFHNQRAEQRFFRRSSNNLRLANLNVEFLSGGMGPLLEIIHGFLFLIVLLIAVFSGISLPVLAAFLVLMNRLQPHLRILEQSGTSFASAAAHLNEVEWLLDPTEKPASPTGDLTFKGLRNEIEFVNVTFEYSGRNEVALMDASFTLRRGRSTAIIGSSGAGKSTIISLLCRLLEPASGTIYVDGQLLSKIRIADWLGAIAVAGQDIDLIDGTIAENVSYGRSKIARAKIEQAVKAAQADFIQALPQGLDTLVGPQGLSLSGGQRQRIGLARALAREPDILILDEATNAIDHNTENAIIGTLQQMPSTTTIIVISHRASTLAFCDDAVVIDHGRVVRTGPLSSVMDLHSTQIKTENFALVDPP